MFGIMKYFYQHIEGAILGSVVGDALGVPGEFMSREELREKPITDMIGGGAHEQLPGTWSDDTSMTLCTIDSIIEKGIDYDDQMYRFADWLWSASNTARDEVFDVGGATKHAIFHQKQPLSCHILQPTLDPFNIALITGTQPMYLFFRHYRSPPSMRTASSMHWRSRSNSSQ